MDALIECWFDILLQYDIQTRHVTTQHTHHDITQDTRHGNTHNILYARHLIHALSVLGFAITEAEAEHMIAAATAASTATASTYMNTYPRGLDFDGFRGLISSMLHNTSPLILTSDRAFSPSVLPSLEALLLDWWIDYGLSIKDSDISLPKTSDNFTASKFRPMYGFRSELDDHPMWKYIIAGAGAGIVSRSITSPLERLKVLYEIGATQPGRIGWMRRLVHLWRVGGVISLWKGNGANIIRIAPYQAVQFLIFDSLTSLNNSNNMSSKAILLSSGAIAGFCSTVSTYPLDVVRTRLMANISPRNRPPHNIRFWQPFLSRSMCSQTMSGVIRSIVIHEGWLTLYRGLPVTLAGIVPYSSLNFFAHEFFRAHMLTIYHDTFARPTLPTPLVMLCGAMAGVSALTVTYPMDLVRRRFQMGKQHFDYKSIHGAFAAIIRQDGVSGLFRGWHVAALKVMPSMALNFWLYGRLKVALGVEA